MSHEYDPDYNRPELPPEAGEFTQRGFEPDESWLETAEPSLRHEALRTWFLTRFCEPGEETPYIGSEGGYLYIHGGPYDAEDELYGRFGGLFAGEVISAVKEDLESDGIYEWAPLHTESDYDEEFQLEANTRHDPREFLRLRMEEVDAISEIDVDARHKPYLLRLLYSSLIGALEAYLADIASYWIAVNKSVFRRFVACCREFQDQKIQLSEIFNRLDAIEDDVEQHLQELVWHRLDKVAPLLRESLGISIPPIGDLMRHILVRHDIVHRGGRTKDGSVVNISESDLQGLRQDITSFVDRIESEMKERFPDAQPSSSNG